MRPNTTSRTGSPTLVEFLLAGLLIIAGLGWFYHQLQSGNYLRIAGAITSITLVTIVAILAMQYSRPGIRS